MLGIGGGFQILSDFLEIFLLRFCGYWYVHAYHTKRTCYTYRVAVILCNH